MTGALIGEIVTLLLVLALVFYAGRLISRAIDSRDETLAQYQDLVRRSLLVITDTGKVVLKQSNQMNALVEALPESSEVALARMEHAMPLLGVRQHQTESGEVVEDGYIVKDCADRITHFQSPIEAYTFAMLAFRDHIRLDRGLTDEELFEIKVNLADKFDTLWERDGAPEEND